MCLRLFLFRVERTYSWQHLSMNPHMNLPKPSARQKWQQFAQTVSLINKNTDFTLHLNVQILKQQT